MRTFIVLSTLLAVACVKQTKAGDQHPPEQICSTLEQHRLDLSGIRFPDPSIQETRILVYDGKAHPAPVFHGIDVKSNGRLHKITCLTTSACLGDLCPDKTKCCSLGIEKIER